MTWKNIIIRFLKYLKMGFIRYESNLFNGIM